MALARFGGLALLPGLLAGGMLGLQPSPLRGALLRGIEEFADSAPCS
jgi:hypothetical protein